jgi:uncharacterized membrane protein
MPWLTVNTGHISGIKPFDPWLLSLLGVVVAVEVVILSSFILMRHNRILRRGERRDHLSLQTDLLAEKEIRTLLANGACNLPTHGAAKHCRRRSSARLDIFNPKLSGVF